MKMKKWPFAFFLMGLFACQSAPEQQAITDYLTQYSSAGDDLHIDIQNCEQVAIITARDSADLLRTTYERLREKTLSQLQDQIKSMTKKGYEDSAADLQKILDGYLSGTEISALAPMATQVKNYEAAGDAPLAYRYRCAITTNNDQYPNAQDNSTREFILNKEKDRVIAIPAE